MLKSDWFLTAHISLRLNFAIVTLTSTVRFDLSDYQEPVIGQVKWDIIAQITPRIVLHSVLLPLLRTFCHNILSVSLTTLNFSFFSS